MKKFPYSIEIPNFLDSHINEIISYSHLYTLQTKVERLSEKTDQLHTLYYYLHILLLIPTTLLSIYINQLFSGLIIFVILFIFSNRYNRSILCLSNDYYELISLKPALNYYEEQVITDNFKKNHLALLDSLIIHSKYLKDNKHNDILHIKKILIICFESNSADIVLKQLAQDFNFIHPLYCLYTSKYSAKFIQPALYYINPLKN